MSYSDIFLSRSSRKVPTALFLLVVISISFLLVRMFSTKPTTSQASKKNLQQMMVVNLSYNQAGIFWQTGSKETGWIIYGNKENKLNSVAFDERDTAEKKYPYINHYVSIKNIDQNQDFFFKIVSNDSLITDTSGKPFFFHTPSNIVGSTNISPAYGKVISPNGTPLSTGMVILSFKNSYPLLSSLKLSGEWLIPLNNLIDKTSQKVRNLENGEIGLIEIYNEEGQKSSINVIAENLSPLPQTIIIGQNYSFVTKETVLSAVTGSKESAQEISIIFPKDEGIIPGESPLIKGTALPGFEVIVIINSQVSYSARVKADKDGIWRLVPKERLPAGKHTLTMITKNSKGEEIKLTRQFTIAKSGEQVLGDATPESTLTSVPTLSPTTIIPTSTITTTTPTPPTSGFSPLPMTIISGGMIIIGLGIILAF